MEKHIELHKRQVPYTLKVSKRAKRLRLAVYCDGAFVVTAPHNIQSNIIEKFIIQKSQWIIDKLDYFTTFSKQLKIKNTNFEFTQYKESALVLANERVAKYSKVYNFKFNKINIKNQKTRWGSCSKKGNLNFNYKIALLPTRLADYIIIHELCHLKQFNHSRKFWNLVSKVMPDYLDIRSELKKSGVSFY